MADVLTLADLPPEVADTIMKRIRVRLRPPLPPELSWASDDGQPVNGPPTETADVAFVGGGQGVVVCPVIRPAVVQLVCEVPTESDREGDQ